MKEMTKTGILWVMLFLSSFDASMGCDSTTYITILSSASTGTIIKSTNYPSDYNSDEDKCWMVYTSSGYTVTAEVNEYTTESSRDTLKLYDGINEFSSILRTLSGTGSSVTSSSSANYMLIRFQSDSSVEYSGFELCVTPTGGSATCSFSNSGGSDNSGSGGSSGGGGGVDLGIGAIAGIAVGAAMFMVFLIVLICCLVAKKCVKGRAATTAVIVVRTTRVTPAERPAPPTQPTPRPAPPMQPTQPKQPMQPQQPQQSINTPSYPPPAYAPAYPPPNPNQYPPPAPAHAANDPVYPPMPPPGM